MMSKIEIIEEVQAAEAEASNSIERANAFKASKILKAENEAREIVEKSEKNALAIKEGAIKSARERTEKDAKHRLLEAHKKAEGIEWLKISEGDAEKAAEEAVKRLIGE